MRNSKGRINPILALNEKISNVLRMWLDSTKATKFFAINCKGSRDGSIGVITESKSILLAWFGKNEELSRIGGWIFLQGNAIDSKIGIVNSSRGALKGNNPTAILLRVFHPLSVLWLVLITFASAKQGLGGRGPGPHSSTRVSSNFWSLTGRSLDETMKGYELFILLFFAILLLVQFFSFNNPRSQQAAIEESDQEYGEACLHDMTY